VRLEGSQTTDDSTLLVGEGAARPDAVVAGVDPEAVVDAAVNPDETVAGARREFGADRLDERTQTNVDADDVSLGDDPRTVRLDGRAARREGRARTDVDGITAASSDVALGLRAEQQLPDVTAQSADVALGLTAQREAQRQRAIEALETSIGAQRADRSSVTGGTLRNEVIDDTELVPGEDVAVRPADGGGIRAEPTQELIEEEASREAQALFGQDLDRGEGFTVETETLSESEAAVANDALGALGFEEGGVTAGPRASVELTNEGVDAVAQTPSGLPGEGGARGAQSEAAATGEAGFADALFGVRDASRALQTQANENVIDPVARNVGQGVDLLSLDEEANVEPGAQTAAGQRAAELTEEAGKGTTDIVPGGLASAIGLGALGVGAAEFTGEAVAEEGPVEGGQTAATAGAGFAATTGARFLETAAEDPGAFGARLAGSGVAGAAVSPLQVARFDVPTRQTAQVEADIETQRAAEGLDAETAARGAEVLDGPETSTTLRGLRVQTPPALEAVGVRARGRTIAGTRGGRPTVGAPSVVPLADDLDLSRAGATSTAAVEPGSAFEADIARSTAGDLRGGDAGRFETAEGVQAEAQRQQNVGFTAESAEEAAGQARAVPESAAGDVAEALRDVDATVFGSAAARAQLDEFRQPRDLAIVVDDMAEAKPRLAESLAGENAGAGDVFDIKKVEDVPGRARGGEEIKFGRTSREPRELDGIPFNPVEEELVRKAGASAFLRSPEATNTPNRLDIGPEPRSDDPDSGIRVKDAATIGREIGLAGRGVEEFEEAFGLRQADAPDGPRASGRAPDEQPAGGLFGGLDDALGVRQLAADERAQLGGGRRRGRQDLDAPVRGDRDDGGPATGAGRVEQRTDADSPSASPAGRDTPATSPAASPAGADSLGGAPVGAEEGGSPAASPPGSRRYNRPSPTECAGRRLARRGRRWGGVARRGRRRG